MKALIKGKMPRSLLLLLTLLLPNCVQETHVKTVTFQVDMNGEEQVQNVGIRGSFTPNSWNETLPLSDEDGDGIFEASFSQKTAISQIQFKFVNRDSYELEGKDNRVLKFAYEPETITYKAIFDDEQEIQIIKK